MPCSAGLEEFLELFRALCMPQELRGEDSAAGGVFRPWGSLVGRGKNILKRGRNSERQEMMPFGAEVSVMKAERGPGGL